MIKIRRDDISVGNKVLNMISKRIAGKNLCRIFTKEIVFDTDIDGYRIQAVVKLRHSRRFFRTFGFGEWEWRINGSLDKPSKTVPDDTKRRIKQVVFDNLERIVRTSRRRYVLGIDSIEWLSRDVKMDKEMYPTLAARISKVEGAQDYSKPHEQEYLIRFDNRSSFQENRN